MTSDGERAREDRDDYYLAKPGRHRRNAVASASALIGVLALYELWTFVDWLLP